MKMKALLVACLIWPLMTFAAESTKFRAAHTSVRDTNMLIFIVGDSFGMHRVNGIFDILPSKRQCLLYVCENPCDSGKRLAF